MPREATAGHRSTMVYKLHRGGQACAACQRGRPGGTCADSACPPLLAPAWPNCTSLLKSLAHVPLTQATTGFVIRFCFRASTCGVSAPA